MARTAAQRAASRKNLERARKARAGQRGMYKQAGLTARGNPKRTPAERNSAAFAAGLIKPGTTLYGAMYRASKKDPAKAVAAQAKSKQIKKSLAGSRRKRKDARATIAPVIPLRRKGG